MAMKIGLTEARIQVKHFYNRYFLNFHIPYSREQKHVSISDTPMLLIEINSISDMGCQK